MNLWAIPINEKVQSNLYEINLMYLTEQTSDLKVLSINDTLQLNSPLKFSFFHRYTSSYFLVLINGGQTYFLLCLFIEMSLPVPNNNFTVCLFIFAFMYFLFSPFLISLLDKTTFTFVLNSCFFLFCLY